MIWIIQNLSLALHETTNMSFLKTKVFKNDETSVTWGKLLLIVGGVLAGGAVVTMVVFQLFKSFN